VNTYNISDVEIFAVGTWNGDKYQPQDLDAIVAAFNATKDALKPYLKIGHSETQKLLEKDSLPAAGWIENLRRVGNKIVADFKRVPKKIYDLISVGAYSRVSSELYVNFEHNGAIWPFALKAVSILGGETPAVATLNDIIALYGLDLAATPAVYESQAQVKVYDFNREEDINVNELEKAKADLADVTRKLAEAGTKIESLTADLTASKAETASEKEAREAAEAKYAEANEKVVKAETERKHAAITSTIDKLVVEKKIVPAQKPLLFAIMSGAQFADKKFKLGDKEYDSPEAMVLAFIDAGKAPLNTAAETGAGESTEADQVEAAKKYASENKVSFKEALLKLAREAQANATAENEG
jgi:hypothetical protein